MARQTEDPAHEQDIEATLAAMPPPQPAAAESPSALYKLPPNHLIWGQTVNLEPQGSATHYVGTNQQILLQTEAYQEAVDWHIEVQAAALPDPGAGDIIVTLTYSLGQIQLTKQYQITSIGARPIHVESRYIQLTAAWQNYSSGPTTPIAVKAGCCVGGIADRPLSANVQQWYLGSASNAGETVIGPGVLPNGGFLSALTASMVTMTGDAVAYVMFFDNDTAPTAGDVPILVSPPITAQYQWVAFDDEHDPQVLFSVGLTWALSATPDTYTGSSGSGVARVDCKVGQ